jgi:hypothetical protein
VLASTRPTHPDSTLEGGEPVEPVRGLSPEMSRRANLLLGRGTGIRISPARTEEARLSTVKKFGSVDDLVMASG